VLDIDDDGDWDFEFEWLCEDLVERAWAAFPPLEPQQGWRGREDRILLRNAYADFGMSSYGSLVAVWIAEREDGPYWEGDWRHHRTGRARRWLAQIAPRFDALFGDNDCLGNMSNGEGAYRKRAAWVRPFATTTSQLPKRAAFVRPRTARCGAAIRP
jgi:hypothetical protein